jgi:hypothetical protein
VPEFAPLLYGRPSTQPRFDVRLGVLGVVDIDDDYVLRVVEEQSDARDAVFDVVGLREAVVLEKVA